MPGDEDEVFTMLHEMVVQANMIETDGFVILVNFQKEKLIAGESGTENELLEKLKEVRKLTDE